MTAPEHEELLMECTSPNGVMKSLPDSDETATRTEYTSPSKCKTLFSVIYYVACMITSAYMTVVVNDNRTDPLTYPPLPDVILDSLTYREFPRKICAATLTFLAITAVIVLLLHKQRQIIFRRYVGSITSLYLWRCLCMAVTTIPVTHTSIVCTLKTNGSFIERMQQALALMVTLGATTSPETNSPVITCGDFMYSGHTITYMYFAFYITRYTNNIGRIFHPIIWIVCVGGIASLFFSFFHYSVDVAVSLALAPLCLTLHELLVENPHLWARFFVFRLFFPLMNYLESDRNSHNCVIQNEYHLSSVKSFLMKYTNCLCNQQKP